MNDIVKRLFEIKEKPGAYIGRKSLTYLFFYILGYHDREYDIGKSVPRLLPGFQEFIQERYKITSCHDWASIILFYSSSEEEAFDRFFELLDEYWTMYPERAERP